MKAESYEQIVVRATYPFAIVPLTKSAEELEFVEPTGGIEAGYRVGVMIVMVFVLFTFFALVALCVAISGSASMSWQDMLGFLLVAVFPAMMAVVLGRVVLKNNRLRKRPRTLRLCRQRCLAVLRMGPGNSDRDLSIAQFDQCRVEVRPLLLQGKYQPLKWGWCLSLKLPGGDIENRFPMAAFTSREHLAEYIALVLRPMGLSPQQVDRPLGVLNNNAQNHFSREESLLKRLSRCAKCGYDVSRTQELVCPECGTRRAFVPLKPAAEVR